MMQITTAQQLKKAYESKRPNGCYFYKGNLEIDGDTMENYGARGPLNSLWGRAVYELYRKEPVKDGNIHSVYFDAETFAYAGTGPKGILL